MTDDRPDPGSHLEPVYALLGHRFENPVLLEAALTHPSLEGSTHYQRLEFVGDRVLGLIIATRLYDRFPKLKEGGLAVRLASLVRKETLAEVAAEARIEPFIRMAASALDARGREAIAADALEAVIGALYLDGGLDAAAHFIAHYFEPRLDTEAVARKDAKSALQEWAQGRGLPPPVYHEVGRSGPDHQPVFEVEVTAGDQPPTTGCGGSKRLAEQAAAELLLNKIKDKAKNG